MKQVKSHFSGGMRSRSGVFYFLLLLLFLEGVRFTLKLSLRQVEPELIQVDEELQQWLDSCAASTHKASDTWTYNPNFLSEKSGYRLGFSATQLEVLDSFTKSGGVIYDFEALKRLLQLSDSASTRLVDRFKYPKKRIKREYKTTLNTISKVDLNLANAEQLRSIRGVGQVLSARIIKFREALGGFQDAMQLQDVYGLKPEVVERLLAAFYVGNPPVISKLNLNTASEEELARFVYFRGKTTEIIVSYRTRVGEFSSLNELEDLLGWPPDKIARIAVYLAL